jgi:ParB-like chromosome segregation protein Spo0J
LGFNDPIAIDENNVIIEGHGRLQALKELGETTVECIVLNHLTEAQKKAYIIAHNKLTMNTGFDIDILRVELEAIKAMDFDLTITGFELEELDEILNVDDIDNVEEDNYELETTQRSNIATRGHMAIGQSPTYVRIVCRRIRRRATTERKPN